MTAAIAVLCLAGTQYSSSAGTYLLPGFTGLGYNTIPAPDGLAGAIGCGPTSGAMIVDWYGIASGSTAVAREMGSAAYMKTNPQGFGASADFQFGLEKWVADHGSGASLDVTMHMNDTIYNYYNWSPLSTADGSIVTDANYYNADWTINKSAFCDLLKTEIQAGNPVEVTVDSDGWGTVDNSGTYVSTDHWMVAAGVNTDTQQWYGFNTYDSSGHWYDIESALHTGDSQTGGSWNNGYYWKQEGDEGDMAVGYLRTMDFTPSSSGPDNGVPDGGSSALLLAGGMCVIGIIRRRLQ